MNRTEKLEWLKHQFRIHYNIDVSTDLTIGEFKKFQEYAMHYHLDITLDEFIIDINHQTN
jgi:hypothetical protein